MLKILLTPNTTQLFLCFFESKQETHNLSKKTTFCNTLFFFFPLVFLQESFKSSVPEGFFHTSYRQPLRPYTRHQLSLWFSMGLRARNRTGHVIIVATTNLTEP